jgi:hypothetical protein
VRGHLEIGNASHEVDACVAQRLDLPAVYLFVWRCGDLPRAGNEPVERDAHLQHEFPHQVPIDIWPPRLRWGSVYTEGDSAPGQNFSAVAREIALLPALVLAVLGR